MPSRSLLIITSIATCALCSGCYRPYGGYGYQAYPQNGYFNGAAAPYGQPQSIGQPYPGSYTVPGGVVLPPSGSTPYAPGATPYAPGVTPYAPSGTIIEGGTGTPDDGWSSQQDGLGPDGFGSGSDAGLVPRPTDMFGTSSDGFDPTEPFGAVAPRSGIDVTASAFSRPVTSTSTTTASTTNRFDYAKNHSWLRGVISPDAEVPNAYNIQYSLKPDQSDEHLGNLVLIPDARLSQFRSGEIVEVHGAIDWNRTDKWGKPMYRVNTIKRLILVQ